MGWRGRLFGSWFPSSLQATGQYYEGAGSGRRFIGFSAPRSGPNTPILTSGATLTDRTYALTRNEPFVRRGITALCAAIVGTGIMPRSELDEMPELQTAIHGLWDQSMEELDADGMTDGYGLQALIVRSVLSGGDCFPRFRPRFATDRAPFMPVPLAVPLQVQLHEAEMVPRDLHRVQLPSGGKIVGGIELGPFGNRVAYHMYREHPAERGLFGLSSGLTVRVPAERVMHVHEVGRAGALRGEPRCASIVLSSHDFRQGEDSLQKSWNLAAVLSGFIETMNADETPLLTKTEKDTADAAATGKAVITLEAGEMPVLNPGEKFTQAKAPDVGPTYAAAVKVRLRRMAAGLGVPYELLAQDLEGVTYSSIRVGLLAFWAEADQFLWQTLVPQYLRPLWLMWFDTAVRAGKLPLAIADYVADPRRYLGVTWIPPKRPWVDPLKDVQGEILAIGAGLTSRDESILSRGGIPERVDQSRKRSADRARELGVADAAAPAPVVETRDEDEGPPASNRRAA